MKSVRWVVLGMAVFATTATFAVGQMGGFASVAELFGAESESSALGNRATTVRSSLAEDFEWSGRVAAGETVEIKGVNGPIEVRGTDGPNVEVVAELTARRSDPDEVRIEIVEHGDGLTFCAVYPTPRGKDENYCGAGSEGRMSTQNNDVQVRFEVRVPDGVHFVGRTVNGGIEAMELDGDVRAVTVNGDVDISTRGFARAETVNGSIDVSMGAAELQSGAKFSTVNGSITLDVFDGVDADIDASWLNGRFESDLSFMVNGKVNRRSARGTLGDGGPLLELKTVNGSIHIR